MYVHCILSLSLSLSTFHLSQQNKIRSGLDSTENETQAMIFERYVTKKDLDEEHAANLKEFKKNITTPPPKTLSVEFTHYEESNTGYMGK